MTDRDIENKLRSAFEYNVPDVLNSVLEQCSPEKGSVIYMTENKKRIPIVKTLIIAATIVLLLTTSVTVAAASGIVDVEEILGFTGKDAAFGIAATYVVEHASSDIESQDLGNFILSGMVYDISEEDSEVRLGLSGLRPVYRVKFKVGGYAFEVVVDAKTDAVLSCNKEVDEGWEEHIKTEVYHENTWNGYYRLEWCEKPNLEATVGDYDSTDALLIAKDWFGLDRAGRFYGCEGGMSMNNLGNGDYTEETFQHFIQIVHGGYVYEAKVDSVSGEVIESYVIEDPEYSGDNPHKHTKSEEYIGEYRAYVIIKELAEELFGDTGSYGTPTFLQAGSTLVGTEINTVDVYMGWYGKWDSDARVSVFIDAKTGEIIHYDVVGNE